LASVAHGIGAGAVGSVGGGFVVWPAGVWAVELMTGDRREFVKDAKAELRGLGGALGLAGQEREQLGRDDDRELGRGRGRGAHEHRGRPDVLEDDRVLALARDEVAPVDRQLVADAELQRADVADDRELGAGSVSCGLRGVRGGEHGHRRVTVVVDGDELQLVEVHAGRGRRGGAGADGGASAECGEQHAGGTKRLHARSGVSAPSRPT
jgi:hypothetical protein